MLIAHENWMELGVVEKLAAQAPKLLALTLTPPRTPPLTLTLPLN